MSAHTPGPWTVAYDDDEMCWVFPEAVIENWPDGVAPEDNYLALGGKAYKEREANLHLIAAAPELLAACRGFVDYETLMAKGDDVAGMLAYAAAMDAARAAIAKAEGAP